MPSTAVRSKLVSASFHQELVRAMETAGFVRMYQFTATTDKDGYHVPVAYAQETYHFFYLPERGFVLQLALTENVDGDGRYECWWSGAVDMNLDFTEIIGYEVYYICSHHDHWGPETCEPLGHVMGNFTELLNPFRYHGGAGMNDDYGSVGWRIEHAGLLTTEQLVSFADGLRTHFGPFLQPTLQYHFDAYHFVNTYTWSELVRERFWKSFPTRLLKQLVPGRILGRESLRSHVR